jgi:hypothetical protein
MASLAYKDYQSNSGNSSTMYFHVRCNQISTNGIASTVAINVYITGGANVSATIDNTRRTWYVCVGGVKVSSGTMATINNPGSLWTRYYYNGTTVVNHATPSTTTANITVYARQNLYKWNNSTSTTNYVAISKTFNLVVPRVYIYSDGKWNPAIPYVYNGGWKPAAAMIYNSGWKYCGTSVTNS